MKLPVLLILLLVLSTGTAAQASTLVYFQCSTKDMLDPQKQLHAEGTITVDENAIRATHKSNAIAAVMISRGWSDRVNIAVSGAVRIDDLRDMNTFRFYGTRQGERLFGYSLLISDGNRYDARISSGYAPSFDDFYSIDISCNFSFHSFPPAPRPGH